MLEWTSGDIQANGIRLHYYRTGGDKPPLVAAHGITDNGLCWSPLATRLAEEYDVIMVDARGHGQSTVPESGYAGAEHAADHAAAIRGLGLDRPALIGHSMGAATAAQLAAENPGLVRCLILEDPPWREAGSAGSPEERAASAQAWREDVVARQQLSRAEALAQGRQQRPMWSEAEFAPWVEAKFQVSPKVLDYVSAGVTPWPAVAPQLTCPVLLLIGEPELGGIVTPQVAQQIGAANVRIQVVHIPGAGHNIRREQFEPYLAAVRRFLQATYA
ncbi:MAG TPA: alpha/beta hydrolase [Caldilineaceae bacterium]|nr:alpha/beta hydrolase [Caldilineaceae bacterium]